MSCNHKILHVIKLDKFIAPFIDFVEKELEYFDHHLFFCLGDEKKFPVRRRPNVIFQSDFFWSRSLKKSLAQQLNSADKIILHSLYTRYIPQMLARQPGLLEKCYWVIWGGDLYSYKLAERN